MKKKVAFFLTHPIQYFSPLFRYISLNSKAIDLRVYYFSDFSLKQIEDKDFNCAFSWDVDLLSGYKYDILKNINFARNYSSFLSFVNFEIVQIVREEKFDLVISFGWAHFSNFLLFFVCKFYKTPFSTRGDTSFVHEGDKNGIKKYLRNKILNQIFKMSCCIFYSGTQNRLFYEFFVKGTKKYYFFPLSVDNVFFIDMCNKTDIPYEKQKLNIENNDVVILFSGKFIRRKNPKVIFDAMIKVASKNYITLFVGDGELKHNLECYAKENNIKSIFLGFVNQSEIPILYSTADILIVPSFFEPWGLVVNEAMCCKCAVIASDMVGSGYDLIKTGENGYIFKADDTDDLAEKIRILIEDKQKLEDFKDKSQEIIKHWGFKEIQEGLEKALDKI